MKFIKINTSYAFVLLCSLFFSAQAQTGAGLAQTPVNYRHYLSDVIKGHPTVQALSNQVESARQEVEGAKWQFMPTPSIGAERSSKAADGINNRRTTFARLQQPLWTGGRLTAQLEKAQAQETIASLTLAEQQLTLSQRWLGFWAEAQAADLKVQAFADSVDLHLKYVQQVQSRAQEGQAPRSDIQLSLTRLAAVQADLETARAQKKQAITSLEQMYGALLPKEVNWAATLNAAVATEQQKTANDWLGLTLEQHPSLLKATAVRSTVQADLEIIKARAYPELYVRGEISDGDVSKTSRQIYLGMTSSFGAGLSNVTAIAAAQAKLDGQEHELEARRREISETVLADAQKLESQTQRLKYLEQAYVSADEFLQASERQFAAGRRSWQELMNTAREKGQAGAQLADARSLHWLSQQRLNLLSMGVDAYLSGNPKP